MSSEELAKSRLGRTLRGKYQLDRVLGVGGMAAVYAATHRNRRQFAVKMLHPELSADPEMRSRFLREGYVANSVNHPNAVSVIDEDIAEDGSAFLVMELLTGLSVEDLWQKRGESLPASMALAIGDQLLDVLSTAHTHGVIHRDLKPANLFLTCDGTVKVLDFGIARLRDTTGRASTATGTMLGTPAFMPPEQALGNLAELDAQSDLWAAGATLFTLISGQFVHTGDNVNQLLLSAATRPARSLASVAQDVPQPVVAFIDRALAFDKRHRFRSASEMRTELQRTHEQAFGRPVRAESLVPDAHAPTVAALPLPPPGSKASASVPAHAPALVEVNIAAAQVAQAPARQPWLSMALAMLALAGVAALYLQRALQPEAAPRPASVLAPAPSPAAVPAAPAAALQTPAPAVQPVAASPQPVKAAVQPRPAPRAIPSAAALDPACARLLERQSLGESLSVEERRLFAERCRR